MNTSINTTAIPSLNYILGIVDQNNTYIFNRTDDYYKYVNIKYNHMVGTGFDHPLNAIRYEPQLMKMFIQSIFKIVQPETPKFSSTNIYGLDTLKQEGKGIMSNKYAVALEYFIKLLKINSTEKIYIFSNNDVIGVWVVVNEASIQLEKEYSRLYFNTLERYPDFECDFMVFDKEEILDAPIPPNSSIAYSKEAD